MSSESGSDRQADGNADSESETDDDASSVSGYVSTIGRGDSDSDRNVLDLLINTIPLQIAAFAVIVIVSIVMASIILRNVGISVLGLNAVAQILGVWLIFILVGGLAREQRHIQIGYFVERLPESWARYHELFVVLLGAVTCVFFLISATFRAIESLGSVVPGPGIPVLVYFIAPIIGFSLMTFVYLQDVWETVGISDRVFGVSDGD